MAGRYSVDTIFRAIDKMSGPVDRMERRVRSFTDESNRRFRTMAAPADAILGTLRSIGMAAAAAAVPVGLLASNIVQVGADYEQAITNVGAVMLKSRNEIGELDAEAKRLGATTKFTATQAAQGMELMARAGFTTQDILSGIGGVLSAAAASGLELAEVSDHVSNVLKGMGLATSEATRVADVLALASSRTNSSIGSLGESMRNVASTARELGIPLEDVVASVALLQDVGLDASVAGSAVNTMLTKIAAPTDSLKAKMRQLGVQFADANGNALPFSEILANLAKGGNKAGGNMDKVAFFAELVGLRGQKAASNLAALFDTVDEKTGLNKVEALTQELQSATGAADKMAKIRMDTFQGDVLLLESAVDAVKTKLFEAQGAPLRGVVSGMTKWVEQNSKLIQSRVAEYIKAIVDNLPEIMTWASRIGKVILVLTAWSAAMEVAAFMNLVLAGTVTTVGTVIKVYKGIVAAITYLQGAWTIANFLTAGSLGAIAIAATAALAAVAAIAWAVSEFIKLLDILEGYSAWELIKDFAMGDWEGGFAKLDEFQNKKAKERGQQKTVAEKADRAATVETAGASLALGDQFAALDKIAENSEFWKTDGGTSMFDADGNLAEKIGQQVSAAMKEANTVGVSDQGELPTIAGAIDLSDAIMPPVKVVTQGEITIRDETGRAEVTKPPPPGGTPLRLKPSGAF